MDFVSFIFMCLLALCSAGMFYAALVTPSPMQGASIVLTFFMLAISIVGVRLTYKEMKESLKK
ncbi:MAG: hypothetical protein ACRC9P_01070 [Bacteroides sp.]